MKKSGDEEEEEEKDEDETEANIEKRVAEFTQAVAPVLLPMIESLGELDDEPAAGDRQFGEAGHDYRATDSGFGRWNRTFPSR